MILWDHPRSRGVYVFNAAYRHGVAGSSPLARGLRRLQSRWSQRRRIIPARAGFTGGGSPPPVVRKDHPRSRGVYRRFRVVGYRPFGSSPLARGLRAHASVQYAREHGSSPLARGLPHDRPRQAGRRRIIPARAGFTFLEYMDPVGASDHPRSRGVYYITFNDFPKAEGSSPLARGLQFGSGTDATGRGIIPARAGFTA